MKVWTVYAITCMPTGLRYVGITGLGIERRWGLHISDAYSKSKRHACRDICEAIVRHNPNSFTTEVLRTTFSGEKAAMLEKRYIKELGTLSPRGMNLNSGGKYAIELSPQTREKISAAAKISANRPHVVAASTKRMMAWNAEHPEHLMVLNQGLRDSWADPVKRAARIGQMSAGQKRATYERHRWSEEEKTALSAKRKLEWADPEKRAKRVAGVKAWWATRKLGVMS